jgi:outer membrane lipase/esterase
MMRRKLIAGLITCASMVSPAVHADDSIKFNQVFAVGDSLSDGGTFGGRFTNANPTSRTWVETLATQLGLNLVPNFSYVPGAPSGGTNYAQGGARVNSSSGTPAPLSAVSQVNQLLAQHPTLGANDLVVVWVGANDVNAQAAAVAGGLTPQAAVAAMVGNAQTLIAQVDRLKAAGAKYVVVALLPDLARTPAGIASGPAAAGLLSALSTSYNAALAQALPGRGVVVVNTDKLLADVIANPTRYGFSATPLAGLICGNTIGAALGCTFSNPNKYLFADPIHPSAEAQTIFGLVADAGLKAVAMAGSLAVAPTVAIRQHALGLEGRMSIGALTNGFGSVRPLGNTQVFGGAEGGLFDAKGYQVQPSLAAKTEKVTIGGDRMIAGNALVGGVLAYTHGTNNFGDNSGDFANNVTLGTIYTTIALSPSIYVNASASYGTIDYSHFNRYIALPTTTLTATSSPSGNYHSVRVGGGMVYNIGSWTGGPYAAYTDDRTKIGAFTESDGPASLAFGDIDYHSTRATLGFQATAAAPADAWRPIVRASIDHDLKSSDLLVPMGPDSSSLAAVAAPRPQRTTWSTTFGMARYGSDHSVWSVQLGLGGTKDELIGKTIGVSYRQGF